MYNRNAFVREESVTSVFFDLEKAYDTTWRYNILRELYNIRLRGNLPICIRNFFQNRVFKVRVGSNYSTTHEQHEGVPQGSVLSTTCFIIAINSISHVLPPGIRYSIYVDDLLISYAGSNKTVVQNVLQTAINNITKWTNEHGFKFSVNKTVAVNFSRQKKIMKPTLLLYNEPIQFKDKVKFLGVIFDSRLTFKAHINELKISSKKSLNLLRVLSYTAWGADRRTLLRLHNSLILSKLDYGCQAYASASERTLNKLNSIHNEGLRISTGVFKSSPVISLYAETGFCSLKTRRSKICLRYYCRVASKFSPSLLRTISNTTLMENFQQKESLLKPLNIRLKLLVETHRVSA